MTPQLDLTLQIETRPLILGAPIVETFQLLLEGRYYTVEVVGGRFRGAEYIYIIELARPICRVQYYCGSTNDPARRFKEHRRKWPRYKLTHADIHALLTDWEYFWPGLEVMQDRTFRRKHSFLKACCRALGIDSLDKQGEFRLLNAAKKHTSNGILMAANQRGIAWRVARLLQADRRLESALKRRHQRLSEFLPVHDVPF